MKIRLIHFYLSLLECQLHIISCFQNEHSFHVSVLSDHSLKGQGDNYIVFLLTVLLFNRWFGNSVEVSAMWSPNLNCSVPFWGLELVLIFYSFQKLNCPCLRNTMSSQLEFFSSTRFHLHYLLTSIILSNNVRLGILNRELNLNFLATRNLLIWKSFYGRLRLSICS